MRRRNRMQAIFKRQRWKKAPSPTTDPSAHARPRAHAVFPLLRLRDRDPSLSSPQPPRSGREGRELRKGGKGGWRARGGYLLHGSGKERQRRPRLNKEGRSEKKSAGAVSAETGGGHGGFAATEPWLGIRGQSKLRYSVRRDLDLRMRMWRPRGVRTDISRAALHRPPGSFRAPPPRGSNPEASLFPSSLRAVEFGPLFPETLGFIPFILLLALDPLLSRP